MRERDSLTSLLARHGAESGEHTGAAGRRHSRNGSFNLFDAEAKVRLLDASLEVLAALRALADVAEDIVRERRDTLLGERDQGLRGPRGQIQPIFATLTHPPPRHASRSH